MSITRKPRSMVETEPNKKFLTKVQLVVYPILGIGAIVGILWYLRLIGVPRVSAIVDCGYWTTPCCIVEEIKSSPSKSFDLEDDPANLFDAESMYHILVRNKRGPVARGVEVQIPYAYYIEVIEKGEPNERWQLPSTEGIWYPLGSIKSKHKVEVNAWTRIAPDRKHASTILISYEGGHVPPYVKTPVKPLAGCVNRYTLWILLAFGVLSLAIFLLHKFKFFRETPALSQQKDRTDEE